MSKDTDAKKDESTQTAPTSTDDVRAAEEQSHQDVRDAIAEEQAAVEENPEHPEEAIEQKYLVGGEVPVNAPGTEGMARE